jgi:hypothetical protein
VYSDRASSDEQLLIIPFLWKTKSRNVAGKFSIKIRIENSNRTHHWNIDLLQPNYTALYSRRLSFSAYFQKWKWAYQITKLFVCVCLSVCLQLITFEPNRSIFVKFGTHVLPFKLTSKKHSINLVASAIPKWRTFKLLRLCKRNALITFEPLGGFGWNSVWRWWH